MVTFINQNLELNDFTKIVAVFEGENIGESKEPTNEHLLVHIMDLSQESRWFVRRAINKYPKSKVILFSENKAVAHFAWEIGAFYFSSYPLHEEILKSLKQRINARIQQQHSKRLRLNFKGGFKLIHPLSVSVIQGKGNYCKFYLKDERPQLYTVRINEINHKLNFVPYLCRINKSLIININNLSKIEKGYAFFGGQPATQLKLNAKTLALVKKKLLWLE